MGQNPCRFGGRRDGGGRRSRTSSGSDFIYTEIADPRRSDFIYTEIADASRADRIHIEAAESGGSDFIYTEMRRAGGCECFRLSMGGSAYFAPYGARTRGLGLIRPML